MKRISIALMCLILVIFLSSCGKNKANPKTQQPQANTEVIEGAKEIIENNSKSNIEKLKDYLIDAKIEANSIGGNFMYMMAGMKNNYKNDIVHPNNSYISDFSYGKEQHININKIILGEKIQFHIVSSNFSLMNFPLEGIYYGCNSSNTGKLVAYLFFDGTYIYEISKDGNKTNEHQFIFEPFTDLQYER